MLDKDRAKRILIDEFDYHPIDASRYLRNYPPIHDELAGAVQRWMADRTVVDVSVAGISINEVMQVRGCHFLMAIRSLNRLLDADVTPEQRARMAQNLRHPIARW